MQVDKAFRRSEIAGDALRRSASPRPLRVQPHLHTRPTPLRPALTARRPPCSLLTARRARAPSLASQTLSLTPPVMLSRVTMIAGIGYAASLPRQLETLPKCGCDTLINGLTLEDLKDDGTTHGCMAWRKNNPHLSHEAQEIAGTDPAPGDGKGYQAVCSKADTNIRTGAADEFEKGWQGGCPADMVKCELAANHLASLEKGADSCTRLGPCEVYRNGATPESEFLCMTEHKTEDKEGEIKKQVVCTPQANGYDARTLEGVQNWGCDHPAIPCTTTKSRPKCTTDTFAKDTKFMSCRNKSGGTSQTNYEVGGSCNPVCQVGEPIHETITCVEGKDGGSTWATWDHTGFVCPLNVLQPLL